MKKCPKCQQSRKVHRSHRDSAFLLQLVGWHRFRCTHCNLYFEGWMLFSTRRNGSSSAKDKDKESEEPQTDPQPKQEFVVPKITRVPIADNGKAPTASDGQCLHCQSRRIHRAKREGLMEEVFYPLFSKYPYKCSDCGT